MRRLILFAILFILSQGACVSKSTSLPLTTVPSDLLPSETLISTVTTLPTSAPTETPALPRFEPADCAFSPPNISYVECGYLIVPEDRARLESPAIRLHVAIARSFSQEPETDPLIYLSGGPGSFNVRWLYGYINNYLDILKKRDVIFFDPRGVGYSKPSLDCPEVLDSFHETLAQAITDQNWIDRQVAANLACRDRLVAEGVDLAAYHSAAMAADVNDLRTALGYDQVNLFGISYGTRTALTILRDYPEILRSVILDSVVPVEMNLGSEAVTAARALDIIFQRCLIDTPCNEAYPNLPVVLDELTEAIHESPITIEVWHFFKKENYDLYVNRSILGGSLVEALYNFETAASLPKLIYEANLAQDESNKTLAASLTNYLLYGDISSLGMRNSVLCSDEGSFITLEASLEKNATVHPALAEHFNKEHQMFFQICEAWGAKIADPIENQPVVSDIPTLIFSGEFDPVTPPSWGRQVAASLENATFIELPGLGHTVFADRRCPRDIAGDFLDDPESSPDQKCVERIQFNFITR